mmetsp:Transcript_5478/g.17244  ORF Transcript_5478/g.17244 Transcript_5478/m.17244 type:complete len:307 (+) Transcript_5478:82-1002(+)
MAASPPDGRRSLHLQPREAGTELPRDAIVLRWEALRELGLALGDKVQVRCTGEAHTETWAMLAWASGRIPAGCVLVPPALGLLSCTGCVELWPAGLTLEGSPLPCTSTSLPIASRSSHSLSAGVHKARRLCGATSNADVGVTTAGPLPLVLLLAGDLGAAVGPELETLAQLLTCADLPLRSPNAFALWGLPAPQGILLHGPAGSGKTRMGRLLGEYLCVHTARISAGAPCPFNSEYLNEHSLGATSSGRLFVASWSGLCGRLLRTSHATATPPRTFKNNTRGREGAPRYQCRISLNLAEQSLSPPP